MLGTVSWWCLAVSHLLSHHWLLGYQRQHQKTGVFSKRFGALDVEKPAAPSSPNSALGESRADMLESAVYRSVRVAAALLRYFAKFVACVNALWLLASNLMIYASAYSNCFCQSDYISLGPNAWVLLFKGAEDLQQAALTPWATGVAASIIVCVVAYTFFYFGAADVGSGK